MVGVKPYTLFLQSSCGYGLDDRRLLSDRSSAVGTKVLSRWQAAALAFTVVLLLALEVIGEQEIDLLELGLELIEISLIVAATSRR
jgi:hypothetical protein